MKNKIGIMWFRQDLRLNDNPALDALNRKYKKIIPIYILDNKVDMGSATKWWLSQSLLELDLSLKKINSKIFFFKGNPGTILKKIIDENNIDAVYWNRLYDSYSINRDKLIKKNLIDKNIDVKSLNGSLLLEPWQIKNKSGNFFKVFTPFWKTSLELFSQFQQIKKPTKLIFPKILIDMELSLNKLNLIPKQKNWVKKISKYWNPGEKEAIKVLEIFIKKKINDYAIGRDRPDKMNTSMLSPYLHFGEVSPVKIYIKIRSLNVNKNDNIKKFLSEIGWREFSYNLLYHYPKINKSPIQKKFEKFPWIKDNTNLKKWKNGQTGIPIIDAGMRQLYETGWMHNRIRMIVGSFLCKNLLIHWKEGEKWFYDTLVDADIASNSAGWQWIAGCGADAAPYFRIFNPILQGEKFDPDGVYVKKFVKELKDIPAKVIHRPWDIELEKQKNYNCIIGKDYPYPIVDLSSTRKRALLAYQFISNK